MNLYRHVPLFLLVCLAFATTSAAGATLTVCASGCQYSDPQAAIDAAVPGDTILLRAGEAFVGNFTLPAKSGTSWITIRSDAADAQLPADGVRLVPSGRPGANTSLSLLPRLLGAGGALKTTPVVSIAPGAHNYRLEFLDVDGSANLGYETLVQIGGATSATPPSDITLDRLYVHGHPYKGMKRGIALNGVRCNVLNSYIADIKAVNADSQGIAGYNGAGPFLIENNYIEAAAENILFGGADPARTNLVPSDITVTRNYMTKPFAWENPILAAPVAPSASASTGGTLAAGTHYFKIAALMDTDSVTATSLASVEVSATVNSSGAVRLSWTPVPGADRYRVYRGTSAGAESRYADFAATGSPAVTYTGSNELSGVPPAKGTLWVVKNVFELKNAQRVVVDGNVIEDNWEAGQFGYAIVITPRNADGTAPWSRVSGVTIKNNIVRHAAGVLNIAGADDVNPSQGTDHVTVQNNLFYDIDNIKYHTDLGSGGTKAVLIGGSVDAPSYVTLDHNTFIHTNTSIVYAYGPYQIAGFVFASNLAQHHEYGLMGASSSPGNATIQKYYPSSNITCNAIAGAPASSYPSMNVYPTVDQWTGSFVDFAGGDYHLASTTYVATPGCSSVPGVAFTALDAAMGTAPVPSTQTSGNLPPVANPGGPYAVAPGAAVTVNGSSSSDPDGSVVAWRWAWGDDVLVRAADLPASAIHGTAWTRVAMADAAGGAALSNPDAGAPKQAALASPPSYVEFTVQVAAGVPYHLWVRMCAAADYYGNDSMSMQFSSATDGSGTPIDRIGTTAAAAVILEEGNGAGLSGWGWNDQAYGSVAQPIYFATSGTQTIRIQQREDGVSWDQLVLSAGTYRSASPGALKNDTTILAASLGSGSGVTASHAYSVAGVYPLVLRVTDNSGATAAAATTVNVGASTTLTAKAGGPYTGAVGASVSFDGRGSIVPQGTTADYSWQFGDEIVVHAVDVRAADMHGRWASVSDASAADGVTLENADLGDAKVTTPAASPANYFEVTFKAAANVPYHLWLRMHADGDSYANDSVWVQFSGSVTSTGTATDRIGTTQALGVVLEDGSAAGVSGWGWADASYGGLAGPIYFNADGTQTIRVQQREDGVRIDQIVISAGQYTSAAPGSVKQDGVVVPVVAPDAHGAQPLHAYPHGGVFPVVLTVATPQATSRDATTATIK